ncbi:MAG: PocR ligand-binding domain-containing protein [Polyangiaceae bacterium]|nr:PocR ligand-binding domain-containing protein [Polyangiaceae bacterium]
MAGNERSLDELTQPSKLRFDDLVDRSLLGEMAREFFAVFEVPLRIYGSEGVLLAEATDEIALYAYLDSIPALRSKVGETIRAVKTLPVGPTGEARYDCFSGAAYRIVSIDYDGSPLGRAILGPYCAAESQGSLTSLAASGTNVDLGRAIHHLAELKSLDHVSVARLGRYLKRNLDSLLFAGHRALLTSSMHLASVRESYRELSDKNAKLQHAYDRLRELDRLKSNFLATVSHELRTPLTSVIGYSEMLAAGIAGDLSADQREFVDTIRQKGEQLLELIKGLLDLSKLESGTLNLRKAQVDACPLVRDVVETLRPMALKKGVALLANTGDEGIPLWADAGRLRQVLLNLTENAIKFTPPEGSVQLSVALTTVAMKQRDEPGHAILAAAEREAVEFRVADTGVGIAEAERERVFDTFYQIDSSATREQGGTGLGLSIVRRLVDAHDGMIRIESNFPRGTIIIVTVPSRRVTDG